LVLPDIYLSPLVDESILVYVGVLFVKQVIFAGYRIEIIGVFFGVVYAEVVPVCKFEVEIPSERFGIRCPGSQRVAVVIEVKPVVNYISDNLGSITVGFGFV